MAPPTSGPGKASSAKKRGPRDGAALVRDLDSWDKDGRTTSTSLRAARDAAEAEGRPSEVLINLTIQRYQMVTTTRGNHREVKLKPQKSFFRFNPVIIYTNFALQIARTVYPESPTPLQDYRDAEPQFYVPRSAHFGDYYPIKTDDDYANFLRALKAIKWEGARCLWEIRPEEEEPADAANASEDSDVEVVSVSRSSSPTKSRSASPTKAPSAKRQKKAAVTPLERRLPLDDTLPELGEICRKWPTCDRQHCRGARLRLHCYVDDRGDHHPIQDHLLERWALEMRMPGSHYTASKPPPTVLDELPVSRYIPSTPSAATSTPRSTMLDLEDSGDWPSTPASRNPASVFTRSLADITNVAGSRRVVSDSAAAAAASPPPEVKVALSGPYMSCLCLSREKYMWQDDDLLVKLAKASIFDMHTLHDMWYRDKLQQLGFGLVDCSRVKQLLTAWDDIPEAAPDEAQSIRARRMDAIGADKKKMQQMAGLLPVSPTLGHPQALAAAQQTMEDSQRT
ncbi:hypothetical protein BCV69DRAFT_302218 [Microstroma glucosiphilum]|uniref:Uncharacterized protein n=1 Tax=Pseudomicrostroma glucosiphilum TaxID=1684307 RepID=A0A316UH92_9BASI|nr:hypothetical protein BCV69DRAFT_302218 [Pseudomicrostroma glucosiphilum]PWN23711.1 hypothetical protein BCV69DRAFT_302218 [Pseudomicrostroma glucosiphilum]